MAYNDSIDSFFSEIISRRKDAGISVPEVLRGLRPFLHNSIESQDILRNLESSDYLHKLHNSPKNFPLGVQIRGNEKRPKEALIEYSFRMSCYLNFLGYIPHEIGLMFNSVKEIYSNINYLYNSVKPSDRVLEWLNGNKNKRLNRGGRPIRIKPRNIVY